MKMCTPELTTPLAKMVPYKCSSVLWKIADLHLVRGKEDKFNLLSIITKVLTNVINMVLGGTYPPITFS